MQFISMVGGFLVTFALLSYGIGSISLQRFKLVSPGVLWFLSMGIVLDIAATVCMIIGSQNTPFTIHGLLGYSAFLAMLADVILVWKIYINRGKNALINKPLDLYAKFAYGYWVIAYFTGSLLVIF
ncbi:MAG: hypothetical protein L3J11_08750 [Draconibacterium sp.]|nr:hypothetical protein [Draconibacterium sp.]